MLFSQNYDRRSTAGAGSDRFNLSFAAEQSRPPVRLEATIQDGPAYARLMQTLYKVVTGDLRSQQKDHSAYQAWVQQRYMDELSEQQRETQAKIPAWEEQRAGLRGRINEVSQRIASLALVADSADFEKSKRRYFNYLYKHDMDAWMVLDPVVSVHPDSLIFEAFSKDESTYGRVTVPTGGLDIRGAVDYGTTNIDFSPHLAREIARIRTYRPTYLEVGGGGVALATGAGSVIEKKIDLPPSWVRGFLQVQSAATLPGLDVRLSASTLAEVLSELQRQREDKGPRSLRFLLKPGEKPRIVLEPWNIIISEYKFPYEGQNSQDVRVWGRRRLLVLSQLMAYATEVRVRLLGTGMPSYWSVFQGEVRFDMGISGWTQNDWSKAAQFDLLASTGQASKEQLAAISKTLVAKLYGSNEEIAAASGLNRDTATTALQQLCREGRAMYDHVTRTYRWRQLFPVMPEPEAVAEDPRLNAARKLVNRKAVSWSLPPQKNAPPPHRHDAEPVKREFEFRDQKSSKFWAITLDADEPAHTVQFGRIGTQGQEQTKYFDTKAEAQTSYEKLIKEKVGKGYVEVTQVRQGGSGPGEPGRTRYKARVQSEKTFEVLLDLDVDGRVVYAECTCGTFRRDKLRKGPCAHILSTTVMATQHQAAEAASALEVANV
jgi:predicted DNA-binding WGR domain protein